MVDFGWETYWLRLKAAGERDDSRTIPGGVKQIAAWNLHKFSWLNVSIPIKQLKTVVETIKPDVILAGPVQKVASLAAFAKIHPLVSMSWGSDLLLDARRSPVERWLASYTLKRSDGFVGDCQTVLREAHALGFTSGKTTLFPWGIDLYLFNLEKRGFYRRQLGYESETLILCTRSFEELYGVDHVIRAFALMLKQTPNLRLFLVGDGSQREKLMEMCSSLGIGQKVFFTGRKDYQDLPAYYLACDVYVSASHSDGSSVSLMEALASGLPVIVSDIPSNREWIKHGENGWLFQDGDDKNLADLTLKVLEDTQAVQIVKKKARETADERANWNVNKINLKRLFENIHKEPHKTK